MNEIEYLRKYHEIVEEKRETISMKSLEKELYQLEKCYSRFCPFCGAKPVLCDDEAYVVHKEGCFMLVCHSRDEDYRSWIPNRAKSRWNKRKAVPDE